MNCRKRVLLVDDDVDFLEASALWLGARGFEVLKARDGAAGLEVARRERPDVIVLDVMMTTDVEGIDVCRQLAGIPELKDVPVMLVTGIREAKGLPGILEPDPDWLPARQVLEKPVSPQDLEAAIRRLLPDA